MTKKYGFFTPQTCYLHYDSTGEIPGKYLKRLAILFDQLVIAPVGIGKLGAKDSSYTNSEYLNLSTKEEIKYVKELDHVLLDIDEFSTDPNDSKDFDITSKETMWFGENNSLFIGFVIDLVCKKFDKPSIDQLNKSEYEHIKMYIGDISADYHILSTAINKFEGFSTVFSGLHRDAFNATYYSKGKINDGNAVSNIESINMMDFGELSWDEIIILRKSDFIKDFRKEISKWTDEYLNAKDDVLFEEKMKKYVIDSKFDFIDIKKPNLVKTSVLGFLGNLPSPIIVNPMGIVNTAMEIREDIKLNNKFKWLYFIQEANKLKR